MFVPLFRFGPSEEEIKRGTSSGLHDFFDPKIRHEREKRIVTVKRFSGKFRVVLTFEPIAKVITSDSIPDSAPESDKKPLYEIKKYEVFYDKMYEIKKKDLFSGEIEKKLLSTIEVSRRELSSEIVEEEEIGKDTVYLSEASYAT